MRRKTFVGLGFYLGVRKTWERRGGVRISENRMALYMNIFAPGL